MDSETAARVAAETVDLYRRSEDRLLGLMTRRLAAGLDSPEWADRKLAEVRRVRAAAEREVRRLSGRIPEVIVAAVEAAVRLGVTDADRQLARLEVDPRGTFGTVNRRRVEAIAVEAVTLNRTATQAILRTVPDMFRDAVYRASALVATGTVTRRDATRQVWRDLTDRGIGGFRDRTGRTWSLDAYGEMTVRTAAIRSAVEGHQGRLLERGVTLAVISDSPQECPLCRPWEGRIVRLTPKGDRRYPTLDRARADGLFHPNCTHTIGAYVPGLSEPSLLARASQGDLANPDGYRDRQRQREMERHVRHWQRRQATALTDTDRRQARDRAAYWRGQIADHVATRDLPRRRDRERPLSVR